jgi:hypothetical protein
VDVHESAAKQTAAGESIRALKGQGFSEPSQTARLAQDNWQAADDAASLQKRSVPWSFHSSERLSGETHSASSNPCPSALHPCCDIHSDQQKSLKTSNACKVFLICASDMQINSSGASAKAMSNCSVSVSGNQTVDTLDAKGCSEDTLSPSVPRGLNTRFTSDPACALLAGQMKSQDNTWRLIQATFPESSESPCLLKPEMAVKAESSRRLITPRPSRSGVTLGLP